MKILIAHNDYGKPSGEEAVVAKMADIFRSLGHDPVELRMSTAGLRDSLAGKLRVFAAGIHSPAGVRAMRHALEMHKPDLVNVHNLYPFISPAALRECQSAGVPVVMTIHNFRLICPTGLFMRRGAPCELCLHRGNEWGCIRYNCENSLPKSIAYAARNAIARTRRHFIDCVDRFACITEFQRSKLIEAGFPAEKIVVIPNAIDLPDTPRPMPDAPHPTPDARCLMPPNYIGFVGRLSREKGIDLIIEAARRNPDIPFRLAGAVADRALTANLPSNVKLVGFLSGNALEDFYRGARFMVMASRWYEGFPMAILESARHARATIGPAHGGFTEILTGIQKTADSGTANSADAESLLLFKPGDAEDLSRHIRRLWDDRQLAAALDDAALTRLREVYSTPVVASRWQSLISSLGTPSL